MGTIYQFHTAEKEEYLISTSIKPLTGWYLSFEGFDDSSELILSLYDTKEGLIQDLYLWNVVTTIFEGEI